MSSELEWRWADPQGQQRLVRIDELRAALAGGVIAPNTPVWRSGWGAWKPAYEVPELIRIASPVYLKFGIRNAPDVYPSGLHVQATAVLLSRDRRLVGDGIGNLGRSLGFGGQFWRF